MTNSPIYVGVNTVLDAVCRPLLDSCANIDVKTASKFGKNVWIGAGCIIGKGISFDDDVIISDGSIVESLVSIGNNTLVNYRSQICESVHIGKNCVIGGFIGERTKIGDHSRVFGSIVHHHTDPTCSWDKAESMEQAAVIHDFVMIGFGAIVTNSVSIGPRSYVCAGAIVSRDVPPEYISYGLNKNCHYTKWKGELKHSSLFKRA